MTTPLELASNSRPSFRVVRPETRRIIFALLVLFGFGLLCLPLLLDNLQGASGVVRAGLVDVKPMLPLDKPLALDGQWTFAWRAKAANATALPKAMTVPGRWSDQPGSGTAQLPKAGFATYQADVTGLPAGEYTLFVPGIYAASRISVDGRVLSQSGALSRQAGASTIKMQSQSVTFPTNGGPARITIDVATGAHRDNGIELSPILGRKDVMQWWSAIQLTKSLLFTGCLSILAINGLIIFIFRPRDLSQIYFATSILFFIPVQAIASHVNLVILLFPHMSFAQMCAIEYVLGTPSLGFMLAYAGHLFNRHLTSMPIAPCLVAIAIIFAACTVLSLTGDTLTLSYVILYSEPIRLAVILTIIYLAAVATWRKAEGAPFFLVGFGSLLLAVGYKLLIAAGAVPSNILPIDVSAFAAMVFLVTQIIVLAERWSISIIVAEQTVGELRRLLDVNTAVTNEMDLEQLLKKIVNALSGLVNADRSSLFVHDPAANELWSLVAEGLADRKIRISAEAGIAGHVFRTGELVNVADAYSHPAFNPAIDRETGIRTRALLTVPIITRDGRTLGVMQALNQENTRSFSERDVSRIKAFAAQAAVAIDNATLFSEVVAERNYNESILRSMSSGVITLDAEAKVVKLNQTACRILGLPHEALDGVNMKALLNQYYPQLTSEIDLVASTGQSRDILDFEIRTAGRSSISVNISIVPLRLEQVAAGVLIILEDITEGKRLQGTMRRFMSQEVVDQVLQRDGELLFGSSCPASILFCDIRNFTTMSERLDPRQTVGMLNEIFTELFEDIAVTGGILDKYIGDAIMATFGAPIHSGQDPQNAANCALAMLESLDRINLRRVERNEAGLRLGIGIASGEVVAGTIGSPKRMEYTVIGDAVNLASRLQDLTKAYNVPLIVCENTARHVGASARLRELDYIRVRGRSGALSIFQLSGRHQSADGAVEAAYAEGRHALMASRWTEAVRAFEHALALKPDDGPSATMVERARTLAANPPVDWDGAWPPRLRGGG